MKSVLYSPTKIRGHIIKNRFMRSATYEALGEPSGMPKHELTKMIEKLATGEVGLIVPGYVYPIKHGKAAKFQCGITNYKEAGAWENTIKFAHKKGSKIIFQVCHGGVMCKPEDIDGTPIGASGILPNTRDMTNAEIEETIDSFIQAALRLQSVGADGIQLHAAHGYLLSAFLSPAMNRRTDKWGGSLENRVRIVQEIATNIRKVVSPDFAISIKMNGDDNYEGGVTPDMAGQYILRLPMIDHFEISCGIGLKYPSTIRFHPVKEEFYNNIEDKKLAEKFYQIATKCAKNAPSTYGYNVYAAKRIHEIAPDANLAVVGGNRRVADMEDIINSKTANMVSLSRPFLRQPLLVKELKEGKIDKITCKDCGLCILNLSSKVKCWNWN
ncbi:oxidoreductase, FAD/FMN-binding family protein [Histomonas meleagridis]|uniref:oxidoreductase, FAD/FMN-binding family protein n=1 Tax=Histomonas meleagridis TaxID=135588 RepID=UPI00355A47E8|nr:oxidoreductase, FAD/FMN-binding family protein [Histomonas meleagridis]KAH0806769.1 oxidoreductase, FAD/FMN-binding family protein [Histomonas meleagridis]